MTLADKAFRAFRSAHQRDPDGVWSAPGRVNLIGEHTDYNDGLVLPFALPLRIAAAASARTDGTLTIGTLGSDGEVRSTEPRRIADLKPGTITDWSAYVAGVAWVLHGLDIGGKGADVVLAADLPTGAGLSSSAAVECATALALLDLAGATRSHAEIAAIAQRAENDFVGMPCGILDQTASLRCTAGNALFLDVRAGTATQVPFDSAAAGLEVVVIDTRVSHSLAGSEYADRRAGCEQAARALGVAALRDITTAEMDVASRQLPPDLVPLMRHIVTENERVQQTVDLLAAGRHGATGPLLSESHESLRDDFRVSCPELDLAVAAAQDAGAWGARMTGGGFGGCAIALVETTARDRIAQTVRSAFERQGLREPRIFDAIPSAGAGRDR
ncbi:MAG: galactokinase [Thermocrispum sp.]